jgi:hypothetical protein
MAARFAKIAGSNPAWGMDVSFVSSLLLQVGASATSRSLIQGSSPECECVKEKKIKKERRQKILPCTIAAAFRFSSVFCRMHNSHEISLLGCYAARLLIVDVSGATCRSHFQASSP